MQTKWRTIEEFPRYEANKFGDIRNKNTLRVLKPGTQNAGYKYVLLRKDGMSYNRTVHRLIGKTYIENPLNKREINHKDCDKTNNVMSNLEWCTKAENMQHAWDNGLMPRKRNKYEKAN